MAEIARLVGTDYQTVYIQVKYGTPPGPPPPPSPGSDEPSDHGSDVILLGCVKTKRDRALPAKDLYASPLWRGRRAHAEQSGLPWWVLSAEYGLISPETVIEPYNTVMANLPLARRRQIGLTAAEILDLALGGLRGRRVEIHAGSEYVETVRRHLRARGALVQVPLAGLSFGEQLAWYGQTYGTGGVSAAGRPATSKTLSPERLIPPGDGRGLGRRISEAFMSGALDLSERADAPTAGWPGMPEVIAADRLRARGADDRTVRLFLTFCAAMDRARDADRLAVAAVRLFEAEPWTFDPHEISRRPLRDLADSLLSFGVSQRHGFDSFGWRVLGETLSDPLLSGAAQDAIERGRADARDLLVELQRKSPSGTPLFPLLRGPKIANLWVRLLAHPGGATITSLDVVSVAVDVQVRKVTEYLGVTATSGLELEAARPVIEATWSADVSAHGAAGPPGLENTSAALDPALWFYGKWGCTTCERAKRPIPISAVCRDCRYESA